MDTSKTARNIVPAVFRRVAEYRGWVEGTTNFDIGSGPYEKFTNALNDLGVVNLRYDPYALDAQTNWQTLYLVDEFGADTATLSNVLNVQTNQTKMLTLLRLARHHLKDSGLCFITVYSGDRSGEPRKTRDGYQQNKPLNCYLPIVRMVFPEAEKIGGMIVARKVG